MSDKKRARGQRPERLGKDARLLSQLPRGGDCRVTFKEKDLRRRRQQCH